VPYSKDFRVKLDSKPGQFNLLTNDYKVDDWEGYYSKVTSGIDK